MLAIAYLTFHSSSLKANNATANYVYTISIGAYVDAELSDFNDLRPIGHIYAKRFEDNLVQVYIGGYDSWAGANRILPTVKDRGYPDAFVTRRSLEEGQEVKTIQVGKLMAGEAIDWKNYLKAGNVYIAQINNELFIFSGQYTSTLDVKARLEELNKYGFSNAAVTTINNAHLVKATSFETEGAKADEIIVYVDVETSKGAPEPEAVPNAYDVLFKKTKKVKKVRKVNPPAPVNRPKGKTTIPADVPMSYEAVVSPPVRVVPMPKIRGKVKRTSAIELQKVLKAEKVYNSGLDGYYGKGTKAGYEKIKKENRQIKKYLLLSQLMENNSAITNDHFMDWEETKLLKTIAKDLDPFYEVKVDDLTMDAKERTAFYLNPKALTKAEKNDISVWNKSFWTSLNEWGNSDPIHDQRCVALKVAYFQSQVRIEDYFMDKGFTYKDAKPMAMAVLKTLIGSHFADYMKG